MDFSVAIFFYLRKILMRADPVKATARRAVAIFTAFSIFAVYLLVSIFKLDYLMYDYYREKTFDQVTTTSAMRAKRGSIYDANMNLLATSVTVWRVLYCARRCRSLCAVDTSAKLLMPLASCSLKGQDRGMTASRAVRISFALHSAYS